MTRAAETQDWDQLNALVDPVRRGLYDYVLSHDRPIRREEAAESAGISRTLAAYHLDQLADAGLLRTSYARPGGRTGPGAGRPAKHYEPAQDEVTVTVPPRTYGLLARLLAAAVASDDTGEVTSALLKTAENDGCAGGADSGDVRTTLRVRGYEPVIGADGGIELRNCPFHRVVQDQMKLICTLNYALLRGCLSGAGADPDCAELVPRPGRCCVVIHPSAPSSGTECSPVGAERNSAGSM
jgi:predicted ArsR family transcriptional regulator